MNAILLSGMKFEESQHPAMLVDQMRLQRPLHSGEYRQRVRAA
jgi:hypothetical protein